MTATETGAAAHPGVPPAQLHAQWHMPSVETSVQFIRGALRTCLRGAGLSDDELQDLIMAASEAAANAVEHAQQPFFDVSADATYGVVTVTVHDHGRWREAAPDADPGWGLAMMRGLADTSVVARQDGTTVTLRPRR